MKLHTKDNEIIVSLLRKEKKKYYNNLDIRIFNDNKLFWQRIKNFFSDKKKTLPKDITLIENGIVTTEKNEVAEKLNHSFIDAVDNLDIEPYLSDETDHIPRLSIQEIIDQYSNHPSILKIKERIVSNDKFSFKDISSESMEREILKLNITKANSQGDIPTKMMIKTYDMISSHLCGYYNKAKNECHFPNSLKLADVIPIHKKGDKTLAKNYRPISLTPVVSKLFEKNMYKEIMDYI